MKELKRDSGLILAGYLNKTLEIAYKTKNIILNGASGVYVTDNAMVELETGQDRIIVDLPKICLKAKAATHMCVLIGADGQISKNAHRVVEMMR